jgi:hypothetical protein
MDGFQVARNIVTVYVDQANEDAAMKQIEVAEAKYKKEQGKGVYQNYVDNTYVRLPVQQTGQGWAEPPEEYDA